MWLGMKRFVRTAFERCARKYIATLSRPGAVVRSTERFHRLIVVGADHGEDRVAGARAWYRPDQPGDVSFEGRVIEGSDVGRGL